MPTKSNAHNDAESLVDQRQLPFGSDEYWVNEWVAAHEFVSELFREIKILLSVDPSQQPGPHLEWTARRMRFIADFAFENELGCFEQSLLDDLRTAATARKKSRRKRALCQVGK